MLTQGAGDAGTTTLQQKAVGVRSASKVIVLLEGTAFSAERPWKTRLPGIKILNTHSQKCSESFSGLTWA